MRKEFTDYVERMRKIRLLSTPNLESITSEEDYGKTLVEHFQQIGILAGENRETVEKLLLPLIQKDGCLSEEEKAELSELNDLLVNYQIGDEIDQHVSDLINERLTNEEADEENMEQENTEGYVRSLVKTMQIKYFRMITTQHSNPENAEKCRAEGLDAFEKLKKYLEMDSFLQLSEEMRQFVFYNGINGALLYQAYTGDRRAYYRRKMMEELKAALARIKDDSYRKAMPAVDWLTLEFRVYDHMSAILLDPELPKEEAKEIYPYMIKEKEVYDLLENKPIAMEEMTLILFQASAMAGDPSVTEHFREIVSIYEHRDPRDFTRQGVQFNQSYPVTIYECLVGGKVHGSKLKEEDYALLDAIVRNMIDYVSETPKDQLLADRVVMHNKMMHVFREYPGSLRFEELCIRSIAAIHPPTYVHSNMVAKIAACLARHVIEKMPEVLIGFPGVDTADLSEEKKEEILQYTYYAALYHDIGKLTIIDTIGMYGRRLLDSEFYNIKCHPDNGCKMALKHHSMAKYMDVIRGHHRYYDNTKGYPEDFDTSKSPYKTIIDIVSIADCMDAATDSVGRSYNIGKTFEDYRKEVEEGAGTRYAPYFPRLFAYPDVYEDITYLLTKERSRIYKDIYFMLKEVTARSKKLEK